MASCKSTAAAPLLLACILPLAAGACRCAGSSNGQDSTHLPGDLTDGAPDPVTYTGSFPSGQGLHTASLTLGKTARKVELYLPSGSPAGSPLLITFHGTNDDARQMISSSGARTLADQRGVVVASPWARYMTSGDWDNHTGSETYWETHPNTDPGRNADLLLLRAIIQEARRAWGIDPHRVYLLGHSSGGFFSILGAMALPGQVAAFVENAAGLVRCSTTAGCTFSGQGGTCAALASEAGYCSCSGTEKPVSIPTSGRRVPGYLSHAQDDTTVSVYYTCALSQRMKELGYTVSLNISKDGGHSMPAELAGTAWSFLSSQRLP